MLSWLQKFAQNPKGIGSIAPSSSALAKLMTKNLRADAHVLELGPGTGAITQKILNILHSPQQLTLIESDRDLAKQCKQQFSNVTVINDDVEHVLMEHTQTYDAIISGIPFAIMATDKRTRVFQLIKKYLKPGGCFVMFQYSLTTRDELISIFGDIDTRFTPWNLPPAFVYVATRT